MLSHTASSHGLLAVELHRMLLDTKELNTYYTLQNQTTTLQTLENFGSMACYGYALYIERTPISSSRRPLTARGDGRQDGAQLCAP